MKRSISAGVIVAALAFSAAAQDWYHDREERFRGEGWRPHIFMHVRTDLEHVSSAVRASDQERRRLERTKEELTQMQADFDKGRWDNGSLDTVIEKLRLLPELKVLDIGIKIAGALDMALKYDLLHCDIKPGNILFNADHEPKLVDFGLARKTDAEMETAEFTRGTPYYVAPEKIKREPETFLSDMYSLGATLYHAIT